MTIDFKGSHYPKSVILYAVFFYVSYGVSYRDLEEIMAGEWKNIWDHAALSSPGEILPSKTAALTIATRCAPLGDHLVRCFFPMRTLAISFTRPSALDVETAFPC